jgi:excisionase family DNA binding protein
VIRPYTTGRPQAAGPPRLLKIREAAGLLGVSEKTVRRLIASRQLPCVRIRRLLRLHEADLVRFVEARKE